MALDPLHAQLIEGEAEIDAWFATLADATAAAVRATRRDALTAADAQRIMRAVDDRLDALYGAERTDATDSPIGAAIRYHARVGMMAPLRDELVLIRADVGAPMLARLVAAMERIIGGA